MTLGGQPPGVFSTGAVIVSGRAPCQSRVSSRTPSIRSISTGAPLPPRSHGADLPSGGFRIKVHPAGGLWRDCRAFCIASKSAWLYMGAAFSGAIPMAARIYKPAKTAMQSGQANTKAWVLDFEPEEPRQVEPLMGWTSSGDMRQQLRLRFASKEEAVAYCERHGIAYQVFEAKAAGRRAMSYSDNFAYQAPRRLDPLTGIRRRALAQLISGCRQLAALRRRALAQQRRETFLRHRLAEQEALAVIAAHADQRHRVGGLLDAHGDRDAAEIVREIDHRLAERRVDLVGAAVGDEGAVELELGEGHFAESRQRGIAAAEIVDRQPDVAAARASRRARRRARDR